MNRRPLVLSSLVTALLAFVCLAPASAQCFTPDNLDGPCCESTVVEIPQLPDLTVRTKYICWDNCEPRLSGVVRTKLTPINVACGIYVLRVEITNVTGQIDAWSGSLVMNYTRTWAEARNGQEPDMQVWRFVINGDLRPSDFLVDNFGNNECVVVPSFFDYGRFHVKGYIDYALDCTTGEFETAFAFDHDCDTFEYDNNFSCRPGVFNPSVSYTWVGPAEGFECDPTLPTAEGPVRCEAFRNVDFSQPLNLICQFEQPIEEAQIANVDRFCPCSSNTQTLQYTVQNFQGLTVCGSSAVTTPVGPWPGLIGKSIGMWTDPTRYPGVETLHLESGFMSYNDVCTQLDSRPLFYGVQTTRGYRTFKITGIPGGPVDIQPVSDRLIDLGNATLPPLQGAAVVGKRSVSDKLIYLNVDFQ